MPTDLRKRIGGVALAVALLATGIAAGIAPAATAASSNDCKADFTLTFGQRENGTLDRATGNVEEIWVVNVPALSNPDTARLDVDEEGVSDELRYDFYEKPSSCQKITEDGDVIGTFEEDDQDDDQKYWIHVELKDNSNVGDYSVLMEQEP